LRRRECRIPRGRAGQSAQRAGDARAGQDVPGQRRYGTSANAPRKGRTIHAGLNFCPLPARPALPASGAAGKSAAALSAFQTPLRQLLRLQMPYLFAVNPRSSIPAPHALIFAAQMQEPIISVLTATSTPSAFSAQISRI